MHFFSSIIRDNGGDLVNTQVYQYGERLETIGDLIIEISKLVNVNKVSDNMEVTIGRYKFAIDQLASVKAPEKVKEEHHDLLEALNEWIESIELLNLSIGNLEKFNKAIKNKEEKENKVVDITNIIGDKLTS